MVGCDMSRPPERIAVNPTPPPLATPPRRTASIRFTPTALLAVGSAAPRRRHCAELMVRADLHGADGHGIFRLPQYVRRIRGGAVNVRPKVRVAREPRGWRLVDGDNAWGTW